MFRRENAIGILLLGACAVVAAILIYAIVTGQQLRVDLPPAIAWPLGIAFIGLILYGLWDNYRTRRGSGGSGPAWPDPRSGQKGLGDTLRDRTRRDDTP